MRLSVFKAILYQDGGFFDDPANGTGKLTHRLATDAPAVQSAIDARLADLLQGLVSLVAGTSIAFYFGWNVAPIGLVTALILVILQTSVSNHLKRKGDPRLAEDSSRIASESIAFVKTVQALTRQREVCEAFCEASKAPYRAAIRRNLWQSFAMAMISSFIPFNFACSYFFGLLLIRGGYTTPFAVFQVIEALNMASVTIMNTAHYFPEYLRARIAAGIMFQMIRREPTVEQLSEGRMTSISGSIEAKAVHFAYPNSHRHLVLRGFNISIPSGKTIALVGPSGCGKSTIIQLLERLYEPLRGELSIDGVNVQQFNTGHLRSSIALVGQEPVLFNLTIRENITYGLSPADVSEEGLVEAAKLANIHNFIESLPLRYDTPVGSRGAMQLSGGQKQRLAIARAIVRQPKILLLDEATSALDTESEKLVQEALEKVREGRTCLVIAHRLSTIRNADQIVVIHDGLVVELGSHQQLLSRKGPYCRLVRKQQTAGC